MAAGRGEAMPTTTLMMAAEEEAARLRGGLRSGLRVLREQHQGWRDTLAACLPLLRALGNVAQQAEAARRVSFGETPLRAFARLSERLRLKQRVAMEALLAELRREKLPALREPRDAVEARLVPLLALGGPGAAPATQPRAPFPAWADLVAGLLDAEALYHVVYLEAQLLLLSLSYRDVAGVQSAPQAWERIMRHGQQGDRVDGNRPTEAFLPPVARLCTSLSCEPSGEGRLAAPDGVDLFPWLAARAWAPPRPGLGWKALGRLARVLPWRGSLGTLLARFTQHGPGETMEEGRKEPGGKARCETKELWQMFYQSSFFPLPRNLAESHLLAGGHMRAQSSLFAQGQ